MLEVENSSVSIVVKNGKAVNCFISENVSETIEHAQSMVKNYEDESISHIVVIKQNAEGYNEIMFEHIPDK